MNIEARMTRLETANRRLRGLLAAVALLAVAPWLSGQGGSVYFGEVRTKQLRIVGNDDVEHGLLSLMPEGGAALLLRDGPAAVVARANGGAAVVSATSAGSSASLDVTAAQAGVLATSEAGKTNAALVAGGEQALAVVSNRDRTNLAELSVHPRNATPSFHGRAGETEIWQIPEQLEPAQ